MQREHLKALATFETVLAKRPKNAVAYQNLLSLESQLDVMLSKARAAASSTPGTGEATSNPSDPDRGEVNSHPMCTRALFNEPKRAKKCDEEIRTGVSGETVRTKIERPTY